MKNSTLDARVVHAERRHRGGDLVEDEVGVAFGLGIVHVVWSLTAMHRDRAGRVDPDAHGVRLPGRVLGVLGDAVRVLRGLTLARRVTGARERTGDVQHHQADRASDRRIGAVARPERADTEVESTVAHSIARHDDQRRDRVGGGIHAAEVDVGMRERAGRAEHHREVLGLAPREHRIDRDHPARHHAGTRQEDRQLLVDVALCVLEHGIDPFWSRRHEGQAVSPSVLLEQLVHPLRRGVGQLEDAVGVDGGHASFSRGSSMITRSTGAPARWKAPSAMSSRMGAGITHSLHSADSRMRRSRTVSASSSNRSSSMSPPSAVRMARSSSSGACSTCSSTGPTVVAERSIVPLSGDLEGASWREQN